VTFGREQWSSYLLSGFLGPQRQGAFENSSFMLLASYAGKVEVLVVKNDEVGP
jgi:hypothetical protein